MGQNLWIEGLPSTAGAAAVVPEFRENTIKSFLKAVDLGVDFVEFDVQVRAFDQIAPMQPCMRDCTCLYQASIHKHEGLMAGCVECR